VLQRVGTKAYEAPASSGDGNGTDGSGGAEGGEDAAAGADEAEEETIEGEYKEV
jgi:hypothetical protein